MTVTFIVQDQKRTCMSWSSDIRINAVSKILKHQNQKYQRRFVNSNKRHQLPLWRQQNLAREQNLSDGTATSAAGPTLGWYCVWLDVSRLVLLAEFHHLKALCVPAGALCYKTSPLFLQQNVEKKLLEKKEKKYELAKRSKKGLAVAFP